METNSTYLIYHHKAWNWNDAHQRTGAPPGTVSSQCGSTERISTKTGSSAVVFYCEGATSSSCNPKPCEISIHNKKLSSQSTCVFHLFFLFSFFSIVQSWPSGCVTLLQVFYDSWTQIASKSPGGDGWGSAGIQPFWRYLAGLTWHFGSHHLGGKYGELDIIRGWKLRPWPNSINKVTLK